MFTISELKPSEKTSLEVLFTVMSLSGNLGTPTDTSLHTMAEAFITEAWSNGTYKYAPSKTAMHSTSIYGTDSNINSATVTQ